VKILDCTIRDGGYYTNWDFERKTVDTYLRSLNSLPVDYLEVGYRSPDLSGYHGEFYYCSISTLKYLSENTDKKLAIILNEKDVNPEMVDALLDPCRDYIHLVRIAIDPANFERALILARSIKTKGINVAFNLMYMSKWHEYPKMLDSFGELDGIVDYLYLVDSYGSVFPEDVRQLIQRVRNKTKVKLGFHGHNNLEMALANTLAAIEEKIDIVDATITGMGRGAGNLSMELLLTVLNRKDDLEVDFNALSEVTSEFEDLKEHYKWGSSLPYMVSGANSLPQKQVMEWMSKRYYSLNSIIRALSNQTKKQKDNSKFPLFQPANQYDNALIIGGGPSAVLHKDALITFLNNNIETTCVIHASSKNARVFSEIKNAQFFCLVGNEGVRLEKVFLDFEEFQGQCILPPFPRKMGTYVPNILQERTFELSSISFTDIVQDSHTVIALQAALELGSKTIYLSGYDGYLENSIERKDQELYIENTELFNHINDRVRCVSITPTKYSNLSQSSIYKVNL